MKRLMSSISTIDRLHYLPNLKLHDSWLIFVYLKKFTKDVYLEFIEKCRRV